MDAHLVPCCLGHRIALALGSRLNIPGFRAPAAAIDHRLHRAAALSGWKTGCVKSWCLRWVAGIFAG